MRRYIFLFLTILLLIPNSFALIQDSNLNIFAVAGETGAREATLNISITEGTGKIFSSIDESIVGSTTQESFKNAILVADKIIGNNIKDKYNYTFDIESNAHTIDGPSAGGAVTLLIISMFEDKNISQKVSMTGSITKDGYIGDVGGVYQKSKKAGEIGIELFFIPKGNRTQLITENGNLEQVDLIEYAYENWGLKIIEVSTINDVLEYAFKDIDSIDIDVIKEEVFDDFIYEEINYSKALDPFKDVTYEYIQETEEKLIIIKENISSSAIKNPDILQNLLSTINYSEELLKTSKKYYENNYFYSAANNSFLAYVNIISVSEIITNPSILADSSIVFNLRLKELEQEIKLTENRANNCSLEYFEWCIGAKQRVTWAKNKLDDLKSFNQSNNFTKIQDYGYAVAWTEIANSFLDISIIDSQVKFVESNYFKDIAQKNIIEVENKLILVSSNLSTSEDIKRRLDAAKVNFERGWYVTSLYDSSTAVAIITTQEENQNNFSVSQYMTKYNNTLSQIRSQKSMASNNNIWSKIFLDHAIYYYNAYNFYKDKDDIKAKSQMNVSNSILNFAINLYEIENIVLEYYFNVDPSTIIVDVSTGTEVSVKIDDEENTYSSTIPQNVFVYGKEKKDVYPYIFVVALFLMILAIVIEVERFKRHHSKEGIIKQIGYLDEKLLEGKISPYTYKEMRDKYLLELRKIKEKEKSKKVLKDSSEVIRDYNLLEKEIIEKQIQELKRRQEELSLKVGSNSIKSVKEIVSNIKPKEKSLKSKNVLKEKKPLKKKKTLKSKKVLKEKKPIKKKASKK